MRISSLLIKYGLIILFASLLQACGSFIQQPIQSSEARLGEETQETIELKSLPPPKEKIIVAVYKFRDQTGQYKPTENGAGFSTAVTQGATNILVKALDDSGWFLPIERENVSNLLNERKIIRSSRQQYAKSNNQDAISLPALLYAGVILEGGIVSYDANVITGGAGLRYFGAGGSSQYRQDRVTIYLRAVSTSTGQILKTVYTSKTILSQQMDAGLFRFVKFRKLLEVETGFTYNEPAELAVTEAIEKAVLSMVIDGIEDGLWKLEEPRMIVHKTIRDYKKEKKEIPQTDIFGKKLDNRRKKLAVDVGLHNLIYKGDFPNSSLRTGGYFGMQLTGTPHLSYTFHYGFSELGADRFYNSNVTNLDLGSKYRLLPYDIFTPYISVGLGLITENSNGRVGFGNKFYPTTRAGMGAEYMFNDRVGFNISAHYNYIFSDAIDQVEQGKYNDYYWSGQIGLSFYFGQKIEGERRFEYKRDLKQ